METKLVFMLKFFYVISLLILPSFVLTQDLSEGLVVNDFELHPMQEIQKPAYLETITDPSFGTTIRRITDAGPGGVIVPMYSTIQAWNSDESLMILYNQSMGVHELLNGQDYQFIRQLDDINPADIEQVFWDFNDPEVFYYPESTTTDFIKYTVGTQSKEIIVNLKDLSGCEGNISMGNDIQMMSWDSDVFSFRCDNEITFAYRISTQELLTLDIEEVYYVAPAVAPSGILYYHENEVYDSDGNSTVQLNKSAVEHSCIGRLSNGNDAFYSIAFAEGPQGGCIGDIIAHDLTTGTCFPVISQSQGYDYPQSGTHISSLAHKNTDGGWVAASMIGYDQNGQELLDQELVIAKAEEGNIKVCRIGHHRSDEDQVDYWGEPHAVISPTGTRVLFGSDWSGEEDGESIDSYVVELPSYNPVVPTYTHQLANEEWIVFPNPADEFVEIRFSNPTNKAMSLSIFSSSGDRLVVEKINMDSYILEMSHLLSGLYFFRIVDFEGKEISGSFVKQ